MFIFFFKSSYNINKYNSQRFFQYLNSQFQYCMINFFSFFLALFTFFNAVDVASADVSGLVLCKDSAVYQRRLEGSVKKLTGRLANYEPGTPAYLALQAQIERTEARFDKYGKQGLLCGADGLPHLIVDGRWSHSGEFLQNVLLL